MSTFSRYAPFIQEYIYRNRWDDLRTVQNEACTLLMDTEDHVIIASGTASGKTEAAFFPVLTLLCENPSASVSVLYISPLRALINDQFERLDLLLKDSHIPVRAWHGESSRSARAAALACPEGIIQITPESLEALLTDHPEQAAVLFSDLRFVMIDELHAMAGTDRGLQLQCLLTRLERISGCLPRRIGLSATLQDYAQAARWLGAGSGRKVSCAGLTGSSRKLSLALEVFQDDAEKWEFLYRQVYRRKCLIFTNSRNGAEEAVHHLREIAADRGDPDIFHLHHGSLSKELRRETELAMKNSSGPVVTAATMTLELGIDIGDLDCIVQIGPPVSVSGFVQRLGRSGRRSGRSRMLFLETPAGEGGSGPDSLPWDFLQTCSVILLYLEERWIEPFVSRPKPFSLLAHQTLAALKNTTGLRPAGLARAVLTLPAFSESISAEEYQQLLRHMLEKDYLERMEDGTLIIGLEGEKYTSSYEFYSVFKDTASWTVRWEDRILGTLEECPQGDTAFVLSGRSWQVTYADKGSHTIVVDKDERRKCGVFSGEKTVEFLAALVLAALAGLRHRGHAHASDKVKAHIRDRRAVVEPALGLHLHDDMAQKLRFVFVQRKLLFDERIALDKLARGKARRQSRALGVILNQVDHRVQAAVHRAVVVALIAEVLPQRTLLKMRDVDRVAHKLIHALVFRRRDRHDRHA